MTKEGNGKTRISSNGLMLKDLESLYLANIIRSSLYDLSVSDFLHDIRTEMERWKNDDVLIIHAKPDEMEVFRQKQLYKLVILVCKNLSIRITFVTTESMKSKGEKKQ